MCLGVWALDTCALCAVRLYIYTSVHVPRTANICLELQVGGCGCSPHLSTSLVEQLVSFVFTKLQ